MSRTHLDDVVPGERVSIDATLVSVRVAAGESIVLYTLSVNGEDSIKLVTLSGRGTLPSEFRTGETVSVRDAVVARVPNNEYETLDDGSDGFAESVATVFSSHRQREIVEKLVSQNETILIESGNTAITPLWYLHN